MTEQRFARAGWRYQTRFLGREPPFFDWSLFLVSRPLCGSISSCIASFASCLCARRVKSGLTESVRAFGLFFGAERFRAGDSATE